MSLPKNQRVRSGKEFREAFEDGVSVYGKHCRAQILKTAQPPSKFGVIITKKLGKNVTRNRIKRLFKEAFRVEQGGLKSPAMVVVIPRNSIDKGVKLNDIRCDLRNIFNRINPWP